MLESKIQKSIREKVEKMGWEVIKISNCPGWPDLQCFKKPLRVIFIEVKKPGETPDPLQIYIHNKLKEMGFKVFVFDSLKDIKHDTFKGC